MELAWGKLKNSVAVRSSHRHYEIRFQGDPRRELPGSEARRVAAKSLEHVRR